MTLKKQLFSFVLVLFMLSVVTSSALAATSKEILNLGIFNGTFHGVIVGDLNSQAELELDLTQVGDEIQGDLLLGEGLFINAGRCWRGYLPAGTFSASGNPMIEDPNRVKASYTYDISGVTITGYLDGALSPDGEVLTAEVEIDIPWFCGPNPILQVSAERQH